MTDRPETRPGGLGAILREAREQSGLSIADVASRTHVRRPYLEAIESESVEDLPEDVYARNFVRLFARTVGADVDAALAAYAELRPPRDPYDTEEAPAAGGRRGGRKRATAAAASGPEAAQAGSEEDGSPPPVVRETPPPDFRPKRSYSAKQRTRRPATASPSRARRTAPLAVLLRQASPLLATLALAAVLIIATVWGFNQLLFRPDSVGDRGATTAADPGGQNGAVVAGAAIPDEVRLTIRSEPPGAEVLVDAFPLPGTTPLEAVPISARESRTIRVALEGYEPYEATFDLTADREVQVVLEPLEVVSEEDAAPEGEVVLEIREATWLEAYQSAQRNQGERLVYTTAQPNERFVFSRPVYLHFGNAPGVDLFVDGQPVATIGDGGAVTGQSFPAP